MNMMGNKKEVINYKETQSMINSKVTQKNKYGISEPTEMISRKNTDDAVKID
jgi:hypothetical protein